MRWSQQHALKISFKNNLLSQYYFLNTAYVHKLALDDLIVLLMVSIQYRLLSPLKIDNLQRSHH